MFPIFFVVMHCQHVADSLSVSINGKSLSSGHLHSSFSLEQLGLLDTMGLLYFLSVLSIWCKSTKALFARKKTLANNMTLDYLIGIPSLAIFGEEPVLCNCRNVLWRNGIQMKE